MKGSEVYKSFLSKQSFFPCIAGLSVGRNGLPLTFASMKHFLLSPLLFAASVYLGPAAFGQQATFAVQTPSASTGTISRPSSVTVADVNGDGRPDALVANTATAGLGVLLGNGTGGFTLRANQAIPGATSYLSNVAVADVNGDGKLDALMCATTFSTTNPSKLFVLLGNGAGDFTPAGAPSTGTNSQPSSVVVADVNTDGKLDALVTDYYSSRLLVLLGNGAGGFALQATASSTGAGSGPKSVAVADVNGDGKLDALTANAYDGTIGVLLGNGAGGFVLQANSPVVGPGGSTQSLVIVDANKDGKLDVLAGNSGDNTLAVLLGNGAGGFTSYGSFPTTAGSVPLNVDVADVNGDGKLDAVTTNYDNSISLLLGNGSGGFTAQATRLVPVTPLNNIFGLSLADVNKDGRPDVTAVNMANNTLIVFLNTTATFLSTRALLPGASAYFYPNPAQAMTIVSLTGLPTSVAQVNATLLDMTGRVVERITLNVTGGSLPLADLAPGLYVMRLTARNNQGQELGELPAQRVSVE
jgi:FG-GAP-like repeat